MLNAEVMALTSDMTCKRKNVKRGDQEKDAPPTPLKRKCMFEYCGCCGCGCTWEKVINPIIEVAWIAEGSGANIILFSRPQNMFFFYNCNRHHLLFISFFLYMVSYFGKVLTIRVPGGLERRKRRWSSMTEWFT